MLTASVCLQPHTDPYDVFIAQVSGEKDWTICYVSESLGAALGEHHPDLSPRLD